MVEWQRAERGEPELHEKSCDRQTAVRQRCGLADRRATRCYHQQRRSALWSEADVMASAAVSVREAFIKLAGESHLDWLCCTNCVGIYKVDPATLLRCISRPTCPTCRTRKWPTHNEAPKCRGLLTIWLDPIMIWEAAPTGRRGRQRTYSEAALQTCHLMNCFPAIGCTV